MTASAALAAVLNSGPAWHKPGAALARFAAPAGSLAAVGSLRSQEFARYGVRISGIGLLIAAGTDSELIEARSIAPIPHSQPWLLGMMNRRGHPIPVFDLRVALELPFDDQPDRRWCWCSARATTPWASVSMAGRRPCAA